MGPTGWGGRDESAHCGDRRALGELLRRPNDRHETAANAAAGVDPTVGAVGCTSTGSIGGQMAPP